MGGVSGEKDATDTIAVGKPGIHVECGCPGDRLDEDIRTTGPFGSQRRKPFGRQVDVAFERHWSLHLERPFFGQGTKGNLCLHRPLVEAMPDIATEACQCHVGNDGANAERLSGKADGERLAHKASAAVGADEITMRG